LAAQPTTISNQSRPLICGHRGGFYVDYPENSLSAFEYTFAHASGLPIIIEFDIRKSKQGALFVMHDNTLERTSNGVGEIGQQTDDYLLSLVLKNGGGQLTHERIPTLEQILDYASNKNILLMLDVKADVWNEALTLVKMKSMGSKCVLLTFNAEHTSIAYKLLPDAKISYLDDNLDEREVALQIPINNRVAYITAKTTQQRIDELKSQGILIMADVSELTRNEGKPFQKTFYQAQAKNQNLGILITDFPIILSRIFTKVD
jgi:glycerophosphoryl diester phosphodiesterase